VTDSRGSAITGWGSGLPDRVVTNADLTTRFDTSDEWIVDRSGIRSRRIASGPFAESADPPVAGLGTTGVLAAAAGRDAMAMAGLSAQEIGMLVLCTSTPDQALPATSAAVAAALGITAGAMDLNAACAGFTFGLVTASGLVSAGADRVLLIGAETMTRIVDWDDRATAVLFADGAGAVVLEAVAGPGSLLGWDAGVDGTLQPLLYADHGSGIVMKGREVFRQAVRVTVESARLSLERAKVNPEDIALFVPHQANSRIMDAIAERLGIPLDRIASVIDHTGNTSAASIPLALVDAAANGRLHPGDLVLLAGFGGGMAWASAVWRWGSELH